MASSHSPTPSVPKEAFFRGHHVVVATEDDSYRASAWHVAAETASERGAEIYVFPSGISDSAAYLRAVRDVFPLDMHQRKKTSEDVINDLHLSWLTASTKDVLVVLPDMPAPVGNHDLRRMFIDLISDYASELHYLREINCGDWKRGPYSPRFCLLMTICGPLGNVPTELTLFYGLGRGDRRTKEEAIRQYVRWFPEGESWIQGRVTEEEG